jgi:hypothetical protein
MENPRAAPERFRRAVDALVTQLREDRAILAAILCGSLSHDTVWDKSDVDLVLITIDDAKVPSAWASLYADGVNVHAGLMPRAEFRKLAEGSLRNSFMHSYLAKGTILYTHDESIAHLFTGLRAIGERDTQIQLLRAATGVLGAIYKAHKFFVTRGDLEYTALWLLHSANGLALIEVLSARQLADREVLPQAMRINAAFFQTIYIDLLNGKKTKAGIAGIIAAVDDYMSQRARSLFALVLEHLAAAGDARSCTEIEAHFARTFGIEGVTAACEYLADQGLIGKSGTTRRLTRRSTADIEELSFYSLEARP